MGRSEGKEWLFHQELISWHYGWWSPGALEIDVFGIKRATNNDFCRGAGSMPESIVIIPMCGGIVDCSMAVLAMSSENKSSENQCNHGPHKFQS